MHSFNLDKSSQTYKNILSKLALFSDLNCSCFTDRKVLDIGSHDGAFDLVMAIECNPKLVIGVDIDHKLTSKAMKNMHDCFN